MGRWIGTVQLIQCATLLSAVLTAVPTEASGSPPPPIEDIKVPLIEWDLPAIMDNQPGAMVVDSQGHDKNRIWFVTRLGMPPRAFRFEPHKSLMKGPARWTSWELSEAGAPGGFSGGLKKMRPSHDRRFVFVRTQNSLQRIDTQNCDSGSPQTCARTVWLDQLPEVISVSDLGLDDYSNVYTATQPNLMPTSAYIQKLTPGSGAPGSVDVKRWNVGGGAGFCETTSTSAPCASGIAVHPTNRNLVYYSEPGGNNIGELNVSTNQVKRWSLASLGVNEPRQLQIDRKGKIWVVTGSGHLVSLDPCTNRLTKHEIPLGSANDPFGVAPDDDVIGYTGTDPAVNKVGLVHPKGPSIFVGPIVVCCMSPTTVPVDVVAERARVASDLVAPERKVVDGQINRKLDGTFVEAFIGGPMSGMPGNDSEMPLGITPNKGKAQGTFFYTVGLAGSGADRVGFVRLQLKEKVKNPRDDDDVDDGWDDGGNHDGPDGHHGHPHHRHGEDDSDDDGFENAYDLSSAQENVETPDDAPLAGGQTVEYVVNTSASSLALIATATSEDLLAQIGVDIYNALELLVATSAPTPGVAAATVPLPGAGSYRVRVRNYGILPITHSPRLIVREPPLQ